MSAWRDADILGEFLARAARRIAWIDAAGGAAAGLGVAFLFAIVGWPARGEVLWAIVIGLTLAAAGGVVGALVGRRRQRRIAHLVEQRAPQCRNLVITADELLAQSLARRASASQVHRFQGVIPAKAGIHVATHSAGTRHGLDARFRGHDSDRGAAPVDNTSAADYVGALVCRQAARLVSGLDPAALFPARTALAALGASALLWAGAATLRAFPPMVSRTSRATTASAPRITSAVVEGIDVVVTPPAYAARPARSLRDPAWVEALAGSRVRLTVRARAASVVLETLRGRRPLAATGSRTFVGELAADADGYMVIEPAASDGRAGARRLVGLSVVPDAPPRVRVAAPGRDLFLPDAHRAIDVSIEASDDIGLASLRLRYTKVSGSGERFRFIDGEVPLEVRPADARTWTARGTLRLDSLDLAPGDIVVYRAVAADHRPGAPPSESDSFIAEIMAPGGIATTGFAADPEEERYAISQQMVILKTERLIARRATMASDSALAESRDLAAEERKVRAEFVFMMGGELADAPDVAGAMDELHEEAEAEGESDLAAGRMANQGRVALLRGIRFMSRAAAALTTGDPTQALTHERSALAELERAFSHARLILRALTERERLDLSRRLTGALADAARDVRPSAEPEPAPRVVALRRVLAGIASLAGGPASRLAADASARTSVLAADVLRVDPSDTALRAVAARLAESSTAMDRGRTDDARALLDRAATGLAAALRADVAIAPPPSPRGGSSIEIDRLRGALADALRRAGKGTR